MFDTLYRKNILNLMDAGIIVYAAAYDFRGGALPEYARKVGDACWCVTALHMHDRFEAILVTEGSARYRIDQRLFTAKKGDLMLINPYEPHYAETDESAGCFSYICFMCDLSFLENENPARPYRLAKRVGEGALKLANYIPAGTGEGLSGHIRSAYDAFQENDALRYTLVNARLLGFFSEAAEQGLITAAEEKNYGKVPFVKNAVGYIAQNFRRPITSATAAAEIGFDGAYFCRAFKKIFCTTFGDYLLCYRLNRAKSAIKFFEENGDVRAIAAKAGFRSYPYFSNAFHATFGLPPSQYAAAAQSAQFHIAKETANLKNAAAAVFSIATDKTLCGRMRIEPRGDLIEIFLITGGGASAKLNGTEYGAGPGDLLVLNPGDGMSVLPQNEGESYTFTRVDFGADCLKGTFSAPFNQFLTALASKKAALANFIPRGSGMDALVLEIGKYDGYGTENREAAVKGLLLRFLCEMCKRGLYAKPQTDPRDDFEKNVLGYLRESLNKQITAQTAADRFGYSKGYFCVLFKKAFRTPFKTYLAAVRIAEACRLIGFGQHNITECALNVGFDNSSYFSKVFKKIVGCPPKTIIKKHLSEIAPPPNVYLQCPAESPNAP
jgi:AraC-like DNA-binding protein